MWVAFRSLVALLLGAGALAAQSPGDPDHPGLDPTRPLAQFALDRWTEAEGLPQNFVPALAQTPDGYLWAASERGLIRFDGVRFSVFTPETHDGLPSSWVSALHVDRGGTLWVGTGDAGLSRYRDGTFEQVAEGAELAGSVVIDIVEDPDGTLWVAVEGRGLFRIAEDGGSVRRLGDTGGLSHDQVTALAVGPGGELWVATAGGLDRLEPGSLRLEPVGAVPGSLRAGALHTDPDGSLWIGTAGAGLYRLSGEELARVDPDDILDGAFVSSLLRDRSGAVWIGTNGRGLFRKWEGEIASLPSRPEAPTHLVRAVLEDREGNLWMGLTAGGLARLQDGLFDAVGMPEGLSMDVALGLRETSDGSLWVGTPGEGVNRIRDGRVQTFRMEEGLGSNFVMSLDEGPDGAVWVGTVGGGVSRIDADEVGTFGLEDGLLGTEVSVVHWDRAGALWVGYQGQGIQRWRPGPPRAFGLEEGLPSGAITTVLDDSEGRLWVGTRAGLGRIEPDGRVVAFGTAEGLPHGLVTGLYEDGDGSVWVATMGGLVRVKDDRLVPLGPEHGLPDLQPMSLMEDLGGFLWISTGEGIVRVERAELDEVADGSRPRVDATLFNRADGMRSAEANGAVHPAAWRGADGSIWFPTMAGAVRVDPERIERPMHAPVPVVESAIVGGERARISDGVRLPPARRNLEIEFGAPTFSAPEAIALRYRLEGFDEEWEEAAPGEPRRARYTNLRPGAYRFEVESASRDGRWTGRTASLVVDVPPRLHERAGVRAGIVLLLLLLAGFGYREGVRRVERRQDHLQRVQKMEAVGTLAGGIAHDFNNLLAVIGMNARLASESVPEGSPARAELDEVIRAGDRAAELTRQLLQFSRKEMHQPRTIDLNETVAGVERMLRPVVRADIRLETWLDPDPAPIFADQGGIEQVLVNLVVNARDAMPEGGMIRITTRNTPSVPGASDPLRARAHVTLEVADDGTGMDAEVRARIFEPFFTTKAVGQGTGLGLASVYGIVEQNQGRVEVTSEPGEGTTFRVLLPRAEGVPVGGPAARP